MADGSSPKRQRRINMNPASAGVPLRWTETQEVEESPSAQQSQPTGSGKQRHVTDCGYEGSSHSDGERPEFSSGDEGGEDAGQAPYTSVGRPVCEDDEEWVSPRKQVRFSGGDGGAASAGGTGGAAHETVDEHQGKEDDAYEGFFPDEGHDAAAQESHTGDYTSYPASHYEEDWRKKLEENSRGGNREEEIDGTAENLEESAAEAQIHEETESDSEVEGNEATAKEAAGVSKELWKENGAAAEAGAAEDFPDLPQTTTTGAQPPQTLEWDGVLGGVAVSHETFTTDGAAAAGRAESPVMKGHCDYCQNEVWSYQERGRMRRQGQDVLVHKTCKEEAKAKKKALQVEVVQVVRKCYVCQQDIAAKDHVQTQHGSRHKSC